MKDKLKYIISLLLLVIFPISAIGLDISLQKCKQKGTFKISFFQSKLKNNYLTCCCSPSEKYPNVKKKKNNPRNLTEIKEDGIQVCNETKPDKDIKILKTSCCISKSKIENKKSNKKNLVKSCCKSINSKNNLDSVIEKNSINCCNVYKKIESVKSNFKQKKPNPNVKCITYVSSSCCSNSSVYHVINLVFIFNKVIKDFLEIPIPSTSYFETNLNTRIFNSLQIKNIQYPLKGPICQIISFIHFTFETGDDIIPNTPFIL